MKTIIPSDILVIIISSVMFGLWHYPVGQSIAQVIITTIIGAILAAMRLKIKNCSLLSVGITHGLYDASLILIRFFLI